MISFELRFKCSVAFVGVLGSSCECGEGSSGILLQMSISL